MYHVAVNSQQLAILHVGSLRRPRDGRFSTLIFA